MDKRYAIEIVKRNGGRTDFYPMAKGVFWGWNFLFHDFDERYCSATLLGAQESIEEIVDHEAAQAKFRDDNKIVKTQIVEYAPIKGK